MIRSGWLSTLEIEAFATKAKLWLELFLQVYQTKHMTPYMHALVAHLPEFLTLHGSIIPFMQQGLERLNDHYTHFYFRGTNHHDYEALKQLLLKKNCIECLSDEGCMWQRKQQVQVCSCCGKCWHTKRPALRVTKTRYKVIPTVMQFSSKALLISLKINKRFCRQVETDNFQHHMAEVTISVNATNHLHPRNASKLE